MLLLSSLCCAPQLCPTLPVPHSGGAPGLIRICSLERGQSWAWQTRQCLG